MRIGIVSGKGGAGKTLVAVNLAFTAAQNHKINLFDLDVEEPNSHLFFQNLGSEEKNVKQMLPVVVQSKCTSCGICTKFCEFNAIVNLGHETLVFPELCHSCYACFELCPNNAIEEGFKEIGNIRKIKTPDLELIEGRLNINETAAPALIRNAKKEISGSGIISIIDAPPGTSCSMVETAKDLDYVIIVAEPTLFGIHDFELTLKTIKSLQRNAGVIINKYTGQNKKIEQICEENNIDVLGKIPFSFEIASLYAEGKIVSKTEEEVKTLFENILTNITSLNYGTKE